jgi:predicted NodU family carbamoyl transferase
LCLELSGWDIDDVDLLCINHDKNLAPRIERTRNGPPIDVPETTSQFVRGFDTEFLGRWISAYAVNHHVAHAASAYYTSPFDLATILTFDGGGDGMNISFSIGREGKIQNLIAREVPYLALW